jgi:hypothetical protein
MSDLVYASGMYNWYVITCIDCHYIVHTHKPSSVWMSDIHFKLNSKPTVKKLLKHAI